MLKNSAKKKMKPQNETNAPVEFNKPQPQSTVRNSPISAAKFNPRNQMIQKARIRRIASRETRKTEMMRTVPRPNKTARAMAISSKKFILSAGMKISILNLMESSRPKVFWK